MSIKKATASTSTPSVKTARTPKSKVVATIEAPITTTLPVVAVNRTLTLVEAGATVPDGYIAPAYLGAFTLALRAIAPLASKTRDERALVADTFRASMEASMPGTPAPVGRHTGRFTGMPVFESQNTLFVAAALANVVLTVGHLMAAWRVELPNAKCDYLAKDYAFTTLSEYINGRHNGSPVPDAVNLVTAWAKRNRLPLTIA